MIKPTAVLAVFLLAAPATAQVPSGAAVVRGRVLDQAGAPVAGVTVQLEGTALLTVTSEAGEYRLVPRCCGRSAWDTW